MDKIKQMVTEEIQKALQQYDRSSLKVPRHTHNRVDSPQINPQYFINYPSLIAPNFIVATTKGTSPQNIFPNGMPYDFNYQAIIVISNDTTAANIIVTNNGNVVTLLAKGTTQGNVVGNAGAGLNSLTQKKNTPATVVSSSAGNAFIIIFYTAL